MFETTAVVMAAAAPAAGGMAGIFASPIGQIAPLILLVILFYFMLIRPQQRRAKEHATRIGGIKRGDTVVLSNGMIGKIVRVEDAEAGVEIAPNVTVKVVKSMIADVRTRGEPAAANDTKG